MKQQLPAKYSKMTVCTFWLLKQLKSMDILTDDQMTDMSRHFALFKESEDQMLFFKDLVENFKEHENYLKMYANANHLDESTKHEHEHEHEPQDKTEPIVAELPTVDKKKNKNLSESELIKKMLLEDSDEEGDENEDEDENEEVIEKKEEKVIEKKEEKVIEKKEKIILKIKIKK